MNYEWYETGAVPDDDGTHFRVWAPLIDRVSVVLEGKNDSVSLEKEGEYFAAFVKGAGNGTRYMFRTPSGSYADPASRFQPEGIFGPSQIVDFRDYEWRSDEWRGVPLDEMLIYEMHVGTFTPGGTYSSAADRIRHLHVLGINTVEIMPVSQAYGSRNWGYDGTFPYSVNSAYGSPLDLMHFIDTLHENGIAVVLDVVFNHLGPLGNVLPNYAPYLSDSYYTPWGKAINFDSSYSGGVREFFINSAIFWLENYRFDGLRLDATHSIVDQSPLHFLEELSAKVHRVAGELNRKIVLAAENERNDVRCVRARNRGGYGLSAVWSDDFHHAVHSFLTGESGGYYMDYGSPELLLKALREGIVYDGIYSRFLHKVRGTKFSGEKPSSLVVYIQNHDQIGNRASGERLSSLISFGELKLAAGFLILSPFTPMLFMGEEYGETAPFLYFVDAPDENFARKVNASRKEEFSYFGWNNNVIDASSEQAFTSSKLSWDLRGNHGAMLTFYRDLIRIRKERLPMKVRYSFNSAYENGSIFAWYTDGDRKIRILYNLTGKSMPVEGKVIINSSLTRFGGINNNPDLLEEKGVAVSII